MGSAPNVRADVFTIGVLAYEMATGRQPFRAASVPELLGQMLQVRPDPPSARCAGMPAAASEAICRAIDGAPVARFDTVAAFGNALAEAV